LVKVVEKGR